MNSYLLYGTIDETLEDTLATKNISIGYRGKHIPVIEVHTTKTLEELQELLPEYTVTTNKKYEATPCYETP